MGSPGAAHQGSPRDAEAASSSWATCQPVSAGKVSPQPRARAPRPWPDTRARRPTPRPARRPRRSVMAQENGDWVLAEVVLECSGDATAHRQLLERALQALDGPELEVRVGPVSTAVSGGLHDVLHAVERAHGIAAQQAERAVTTVRLESRTPPLSLAEREQEAAELQHGRGGGVVEG
ncbi:MAG: hypothetical protein BRC31_05435 [Actinobacteria bacterium QS_5_72_10]|nr:MAG: hypothetical protein BRC31_05435 [Actinobacteria bacterium QS_5_72_10]